jgi:iron complex outermembrane receptor protein
MTAKLPFGFTPRVAALILSAQYLNGRVTDSRLGYGADDSPVVDLAGKSLPRSPVLSINYSLSQNIETPVGYFDWVVSAQSKTKQYMTPFNGEGTDTSGKANPALSDVVQGYTRLDLGVGFTRPDGKIRVDAFMNNVTNIAYMTTLINTPGLNLRYFNPPRTFGMRLTMYL